MRADTEQIDELIDSLPRQPYGTGSRREDCRELVREVRKQDDALIRQMLDALTAPYDGVKLHGIQMAAITAARARPGGKCPIRSEP